MYFLPAYRRGIFNRYHKKMPLFERFTKDFAQAFLWIRNYFKSGFKRRTILAYPHFPSRGSMLYKMAKELGWNITNKPSRKFEAVIYWEYATFREEFALMEQLASDFRVINLYHRDISKEKVDALKHEIFGYRTRIDPTQYQGKAVEKSDINALHNYEVIDCPITERKPGCFYQVLINNEVENGTKVQDIRVPVIGGLLDFVYIKHRAINDRFKNPIYCKPTPIKEVLSKKEIELLQRYIQSYQLDFGEMDVLRDQNSGKIFVIDVNNTPQGPPSGISAEDARWVIHHQATIFKKRLLGQ
jgi:hypothetical protein